MEMSDKQFLQEHINNWHTVQNGYIRNIELNILKSYEAIYRKNIDSNFICIVWCGNCKMEMITRLYNYYESLETI